MKKATAFLLALVMVMGTTLCGCGKPTVVEPEDVELTCDNIKEYLQFNLEYGDYEKSTALGLKFIDIDVNLDIYPITAGTLSNVKMTVEVSLPEDWSVVSNDSAYEKNDTSKMVLDITMPADGKYSATHRIGRALWAATPSRDCTLSIKSVSGTFVPDK